MDKVNQEALYKKVNSRLEKLKIGSPDNISERILQYLLAIEEIIELSNTKREALLKEYKASRLNNKYIAAQCGMSRSTIYNNKEILEPYIADAIEMQEKEDIFENTDNLLNKVEELKQVIIKLEIRDIKTEQLEYTIDELKSTIVTQLQTIETLKIRNSKLIDQMDNLKRGNNNNLS